MMVGWMEGKSRLSAHDNTHKYVMSSSVEPEDVKLVLLLGHACMTFRRLLPKVRVALAVSDALKSC